MKRQLALLMSAAALAGALATGAAAQAPCTDCGVVQSIRSVEKKGEGTGLGAIAGGVAGGVLGHQIGSGRGNTVATIAGAGVGAYAGHQVEKNVKSTTSWNVTIKMDSGQVRTFTYSSRPQVNEGERVKLVDGGRRLALVTN